MPEPKQKTQRIALSSKNAQRNTFLGHKPNLKTIFEQIDKPSLDHRWLDDRIMVKSISLGRRLHREFTK